MKKYCDYLVRIAHALAKDAERMLPETQLGLSRDLTRITSLAKTRGLPLFTMDLPALGKWLDYCLSQGTYTRPDLPLSRHFKNGSPIPKLFQGLVLRVFDEAGVLRKKPCTDSIAILRQFYLFGKKLTVQCKERYIYESIKDFYDIEVDLPNASCSWESFTPISEQEAFLKQQSGWPLLSFDSEAIESLDESLRALDSDFSAQDLLTLVQLEADHVMGSFRACSPISDWGGSEFLPRHGPGVVSDLKKGESKYDFAYWPEQLEQFFPQAEFAFVNYDFWLESPVNTVGKEDSYSSKLIVVPKTQKGPRLIAAEPVAHQWCQQMVLRYLNRAVERMEYRKVIKFDDQTQNQKAALAASKSGLSWTVDLSAASDRLSTRLVERLWRNFPFMLDSLHASRTKYVRQILDKKSPSHIPLKKFSTMGSACTFPVQSITFAILAVASSIYVTRKPRWQVIEKVLESTSVFGDDIIVSSDAGRVLELLLTHLGFKVNESKTFRTGKFRESCGLDAYDGVEVTPAYVRKFPAVRQPESVVSSVETSNNFYLKGYWATAEEIRSSIGNDLIPIVPIYSGQFGYVSLTGAPAPARTRWNDGLHRVEFRTLKIKSTVEKNIPQTPGTLLQYFTELPETNLDVLFDIRDRDLGTVLRASLKLRAGWEDIARLAAR